MSPRVDDSTTQKLLKEFCIADSIKTFHTYGSGLIDLETAALRKSPEVEVEWRLKCL